MLADVVPLQRERLLGAQAGIGQHRHERRVSKAPLGQQPRAQLLDLGRRERHDRPPAGGRRLARRPDRIRGDALPLDGPLEHALDHGHGAADRLLAHTLALQLGAEADDRLRREIAQAHGAEPRQRVTVPEVGVVLERAPLEVGDGVELPPLLGELGQGLAPGVEVGQRVRALERPDLALEGARVGAAVEAAAALALALVPAHPPDHADRAVTAAALASLDHRGRISSGTASVPRPPCRGGEVGNESATSPGARVSSRGAREAVADSHASRSSSRIR
ncbi:MAG: hypothetical protein M3N16_01990 [Actinomycetota bacterium]|nr:hypothetical protein [Actinomycetota bacterium]